MSARSPDTPSWLDLRFLLRLPQLLTGVLLRLVSDVLLGTLQAYKLFISPLLGSRCRFHPSCSCYAQQSIRRFGPLRGGWLAAKRLARCGPWHPGGIDEVPTAPSIELNPRPRQSRPCAAHDLSPATSSSGAALAAAEPVVNRNRA